MSTNQWELVVGFCIAIVSGSLCWVTVRTVAPTPRPPPAPAFHNECAECHPQPTPRWMLRPVEATPTRVVGARWPPR